MSGSSSTSPLTENCGRRNRRLGDRVGHVGPLTVEAAGLQLVAQDPRRAAARDRRGGSVLDERVLGRGEQEAAVGRHAGALEAEVLAHAAPGGRHEVLRHRQLAEERPVERVATHEGAHERVREALGREDQLAVLGQRQALRVDGPRRVRHITRREQVRHGLEAHVAVRQAPVAHVEPEGVEADVGLIVGDRVEHAPPRVIGDRGEPADARALERRPGRHDRLPEELEAGLRPLRRRRRGQHRHRRERRHRCRELGSHGFPLDPGPAPSAGPAGDRTTARFAAGGQAAIGSAARWIGQSSKRW